MTHATLLVLATLAALEVKHFLFDYLFQTPWQIRNKGTYGHPGGIVHAGLHSLGTLAAFLVIPPGLALGLAIVAGEFIVHYHIDWTKEQVGRALGLSAERGGYWALFGTDQLLHHLTYVAIAGILAAHAGY